MTLELYIDGELVVEELITKESRRLHGIRLANYARRQRGKWELILTGVPSRGNGRNFFHDIEKDLDDFIKKEKKRLYEKDHSPINCAQPCYPSAFEL